MMQDLFLQLKKNISGEVRFDAVSRVLYSTDASIYEIEPLGVVLPRTRQDILVAMQICAEHQVALIARGGGTSQTGACLGRGVILDCSKYMQRVLEINREEMWARVEPGVVVDELNAELRAHGIMFAVDVSPANRANIGGMCGTNAGGSRSIVYGKMVDNVNALKVLFADGRIADARALSNQELKSKLTLENLEGEAYRALTGIAAQHRGEIEKRFPQIQRRVGGYNLDEFIKPQPFNLAKILIGSEGTLAVTLEAQLKLVPRPKHTAVDVIHFKNVQEALQAAPLILPLAPSQVELADKVLLDMTRGQIEYARRMTRFVQGDPGALLVVEFFGESETECKDKIEKLEETMSRARTGYAFTRALDIESQQNILAVRKSGLGLLLGMKGDHKPIAFVEDSAVAPEHLAEYIRRFDEIVRAHNTRAAYYAHASVGLLHIRPLINLKQVTEIEKMHSLARAISDLVMEYGGAISGEHGDGLLRSEFIEKIFGAQLYGAFKKLKHTFDPKNLLNPGKITDAQTMVENLRLGANYRARPVKTFFSFAREGGFDRAIEMCNGNGECRKRLTGTMCPSYMVTREEKHSTRGRANALRAAISGHLPGDALTSKEMFDVLDLCLECKGCKAECPSNVDMAKLKYEFLAQYHARHGVPLRAWLFGNIATLNKIGSLFAPVSNWVMQSRGSHWALEKFVGIDARRSLPPFARQTFAQWFKSRPDIRAQEKKQVALFNDTFVNFNYPEIGRAAVKVLETLGYEVILADAGRKCCGRPMISKGLIEPAKSTAAWNVAALARYAERGIPILGLEPSCLLTLRDEYPDLVDDPRAATVAANAFLIEEFLCREMDAGNSVIASAFALLSVNSAKQSPRLGMEIASSRKSLLAMTKTAPRKILFHGHCHQKAIVGSAPSLRVMRSLPNVQVTEIDSGCCGMAGSFGFEKEHYEISQAIGERRLFPQIRKEPESEIVAAGVSCRQQIAHATGRRARHLVEILADELP
ncbi:MAG: anaerobic glycerol-3-phosphate dehydrogenase subunit C [Chloroflexi bacterium]|nr:anaerobic glycerol-3-phosphate dehydrogenase subunit C [Chloroflexota bacterium]